MKREKVNGINREIRWKLKVLGWREIEKKIRRELKRWMKS